MMATLIKNRWSSATIHGSEKGTLREAVLEAVSLEKSISEADLCWADLRRANIREADLREANLCGANLREANLTPIRDDIWALLSSAPAEVPALREALITGKVDGSTYGGECACLVGTLAHARQCSEFEIPGLRPNADRPAERFFLAIAKGDTPETNQFSALALEWVDDWLARMREAFGPAQPAQT